MPPTTIPLACMRLLRKPHFIRVHYWCSCWTSYFFKTYDMALRMLERFRFSQLCKAGYIHGFRKHCRIIHCSGLFSHMYVRSTDTTQKSQDCQETIRSAKLEEDAPRELCICTSRDDVMDDRQSCHTSAPFFILWKGKFLGEHRADRPIPLT